MLHLEIQALVESDGDYEQTDDDSKATEFGVYYRAPMSMHVTSFATRQDAENYVRVVEWAGA